MPVQPAPAEVLALLPVAPRDYLILFALDDGPLHGHGILKSIESGSGGVPFDPANLYGSLRKLERDALVLEATGRAGDAGGPPRRFYRLDQARTRRADRRVRSAGQPHRRRAQTQAGHDAAGRAVIQPDAPAALRWERADAQWRSVPARVSVPTKLANRLAPAGWARSTEPATSPGT